MSYSITLTNGTVKTEVGDGSLDQTSTDLTLVGKNRPGYGLFLNDNFVKLLENFANTSQPNYPLTGQLWYDTSQNKLKVYNGASFVSTSSTSVSATPPSGAGAGDLWIDSTKQQLHFYIDSSNHILAGPIYTAEQGLSGFQTETILDTNLISHTVLLLYVGQSLFGIFSKDRFIPKDSLAGWPDNTYVEIGFNVSSYAGIKFNVPVSASSALLAADNTTLKYAENFVSSTDLSASMRGTLTIANDSSLVLGALANTEIIASTSNLIIQSTNTAQNFQLNLLNGSNTVNAIYVNPTTMKVGIFTNSPTAGFDVNGTAAIRGALALGFTDTPQAITSLGAGNTYIIEAVGNSDFTLIGASSNSYGVKFTATGPGTGTGTARLVVTSTVSGMTDPTDLQDGATKNYVDTRSLRISIPSTNNSTISTILAKVFPSSEYQDGSIARVVTSDPDVREFQLVSGVWDYVGTL